MKKFVCVLVAVCSSMALALETEAEYLVPNGQLSQDYGVWSASYPSLDKDNFQSQVINDKDSIWVVAYVKPTCRSCTRLAEQYKDLTSRPSITSRKVKFGFVDISKDVANDVVSKYSNGHDVTYTPTVLVYGADKSKPTAYSGDYSANDLDKHICGVCDKQGFSPAGAIQPKAVTSSGGSTT